VTSTAFDLPSGPVIVWVLVALALAWQALGQRVVAQASTQRTV
jgi:hypothetical protein